MRAKSVIIIASGRAQYASAGQLDRAIQAVTAMGKRPVVVIGPDGDDLLRTSESIEACELVFDPNYNGGIFSGIKAGLHAVNGAAFVMPLGNETTLDFAHWSKLEEQLPSLPPSLHVLRPITQNSKGVLYPQIVTMQGLVPLKALPATTDWSQADCIQAETVMIDAA